MLGRVIRDPDHVESAVEEMEGLGLLPVETTFAGDKATRQTRAQVVGGPAWLASLEGQAVDGYEIHVGRTVGSGGWLVAEGGHGDSASGLAGAASADGRVWGTYLHGIFQNAGFRRAWVRSFQGQAFPSARRAATPTEVNRILAPPAGWTVWPMLSKPR